MTQAQTDAVKALLFAGGLCSNICYNLAQRDQIPEQDKQSMRVSQKEWDKAVQQWHFLQKQAEIARKKSPKKAAASRENGKKGGWPKGRPRPKKVASPAK